MFLKDNLMKDHLLDNFLKDILMKDHMLSKTAFLLLKDHLMKDHLLSKSIVSERQPWWKTSVV